MNREWSFYDAATGILAPTFASLPPDADPQAFAPRGCIPTEGRLDPKTQRISLKTGKPVKHTPKVDLDIEGARVRARRDMLLAACDWTQLPDAAATMSVQRAADWKAYRTALRKLTDQPGFPMSVAWPTAPDS